MDNTTIVNLLTNSGLKDVQIIGDFIQFQDPSCIFPAFDTILHYAWIVVVMLTVIMLFGWAILYIKNGTRIDNVFNNAKALILIFCVLSVVKPAINVVYGNNLFEKQCETKTASLSRVQELVNMRKEHLGSSDAATLYESFVVIDSGARTNMPTSND